MRYYLFLFAALFCTGASQAAELFEDADANLDVIAMTSDGEAQLVRRYGKYENVFETGLVKDGAFIAPVVPENRSASHREIRLTGLADNELASCTLLGASGYIPGIWDHRTRTVTELGLPPVLRGELMSGYTTALCKNGGIVAGYYEVGHGSNPEKHLCLWMLQQDGTWKFSEPETGVRNAVITAFSKDGTYCCGDVPTEIPGVETKAFLLNLKTNAFKVIPSDETAIAAGVNESGNMAVETSLKVHIWLEQKGELEPIAESISTPSGISEDNKISGWVEGALHPEYGRVWGPDGAVLLTVKERSKIRCMADHKAGGYAAAPESLVRKMLVTDLPK